MTVPYLVSGEPPQRLLGSRGANTQVNAMLKSVFRDELIIEIAGSIMAHIHSVTNSLNLKGSHARPGFGATIVLSSGSFLFHNQPDSQRTINYSPPYYLFDIDFQFSKIK